MSRWKLLNSWARVVPAFRMTSSAEHLATGRRYARLTSIDTERVLAPWLRGAPGRRRRRTRSLVASPARSTSLNAVPGQFALRISASSRSPRPRRAGGLPRSARSDHVYSRVARVPALIALFDRWLTALSARFTVSPGGAVPLRTRAGHSSRRRRAALAFVAGEIGCSWTHSTFDSSGHPMAEFARSVRFRLVDLDDLTHGSADAFAITQICRGRPVLQRQDPRLGTRRTPAARRWLAGGLRSEFPVPRIGTAPCASRIPQAAGPRAERVITAALDGIAHLRRSAS